MTGFGAAEGSVAGGILRVEVKSVNHRYLSLAFKAPGDVALFEAEIRERLRRDFERGHFAVSIRWLESPAGETGGLRLNADGVREAMARLRALESAAGLQNGVTLDLLARQPEVFSAATDAVPTVAWSEIDVVVGAAVAELREARRREGRALGSELTDRLGSVRTHLATVAARAPERLLRERDRLRAQVAQLLDGRPVDEQRLAQELAFIADRLDITEEIVRLGAHLDAVVAALTSDRPMGKQLGFLAQEMGREVNTIGSKANDHIMQHVVVEMKGELERFREQLENLE